MQMMQKPKSLIYNKRARNETQRHQSAAQVRRAIWAAYAFLEIIWGPEVPSSQRRRLPQVRQKKIPHWNRTSFLMKQKLANFESKIIEILIEDLEDFFTRDNEV
jgi:hypothetical protein